MKVLSVCAFAALAASAALGADVSWTGGAGDNKWATGGNWSTGSKPGEGDVAVFAKNAKSGWGAPSFVSFAVVDPAAPYSDPVLTPPPEPVQE